MTKAEIIKAVADSTSEDKKLVAGICNAFLFEIKETLSNGGDVRIARLGKFQVKVHFSASKNLYNLVNGK